MTIPVSNLFAPTPPGVSTQNPTSAAPSASWLGTLLADAAALNLPTTTWQAGDPLRTAMAIMAVELSKEDGAIAMQAQGGFLDYAATGTVTLTDINGKTATLPVSPDPSIPGQNPTGLQTWVDLLASSVYNVKRVAATAATNPFWLVNTSGSSLGTFQPGTFHVANFVTQATYSNQAVFTNAPSSTAGTTITNVVGNAVTTSAAHGLVTGAVVYLTGVIGPLFSGLVGSGVTSSSGFATITQTGTNTFTLNGASSSGAYVSGGLVYVPQSVQLAADQVGTYGNAAVGTINQLVTASPLCFCANLLTFAGAPWQSNVSLAANCRAKLATLSPNGPAGAFVFYALASYLILNGSSLPGSPPGVTQAISNYLTAVGLPPLVNPLPSLFTLDGGPITRAVCLSNKNSGVATTVVANAGGPVAGCINLAITGATAASPIVITAAAHGCQNSDWVNVQLVQGMTGVNGTFQCTRVDANHVSLNGSSGGGAYTAGTGQISGGDLFAVSAVIQAYCTPNTTTQITQSASAVAVTVAATVYVPRAQVGAYTTSATLLVTSYLAGFPIGGLSVDGAVNVLPIGAIEGLLFAAGQQQLGVFYTLSVTGVTLNGSPSDLSLGTNGVVSPVTISLTVVPV